MNAVRIGPFMGPYAHSFIGSAWSELIRNWSELMELMMFMGARQRACRMPLGQPIDLPPVLRPIAKGARGRIMRAHVRPRARPT